MRLNGKWILGLCLAAFASTGLAKSNVVVPPPAPLENVVVMQVDGWLSIDTEGRTEKFNIDTPLTGVLKENLERVARGWKFKPVTVDGVPRRATTPIRVTLSASKQGEGYRVAVDNVTFPADPKLKTTTDDAEKFAITVKRLLPPGYPMDLMQMGVEGAVLLAVEIGPDGRVKQVLAVQSMLYDVRGREIVLRQAIGQFELVAVNAARLWRFNVPAADTPRSSQDMTALVPVNFMMIDKPKNQAGVWRTVIRQPKRAIDWLPVDPSRPTVGIADTTGGGVIPLDGGAIRLDTDASIIGSVVM